MSMASVQSVKMQKFGLLIIPLYSAKWVIHFLCAAGYL